MRTMTRLPSINVYIHLLDILESVEKNVKWMRDSGEIAMMDTWSALRTVTWLCERGADRELIVAAALEALKCLRKLAMVKEEWKETANVLAETIKKLADE